MDTLGNLGSIGLVMEASTNNLSADLQGIGADLEATAAKAKAAGDQFASSFRTMTTAAERYRQSWSRELAQQAIATRAQEETERAYEMAALKADILARADAKLAESAVPIGNAFQRASAEIRASLDQVGEKIAATAERAELSADGIATGFGGLGKLLGLGIVGDFAAHMLDNFAQLNVTLGDLHEKTGMAVQDLAGLRLAALSKNLDFTTIAMGLTRFGHAIYEARQGMMEAREAFSALGISMKEVQTDSVEQMFYRVSQALGENKSLVIADGTALELFGRGGKELIPMLRQWGGGLEALAKQQAQLTGISSETVAASQQWLIATQDLSAEIHGDLGPAILEIVKLIQPVKAGFHFLAVAVETTLGSVIDPIIAATIAMGGFGRVLKDVSEGNPFAAMADARASLATIQSRNRDETASIQRSIHLGVSAWDYKPPAHIEGFTGADDVDGALLKQAKQQLADMERKHALTRAQLIKFWQQQLAKAQPGTVDYEQVNQVLGNLMQRAGSAGAVRAPAAPAVPVLRTKGSTPIEDAQRQAAKTAAASQNDAAKFQADRFEAALKANDAQVAAMREAQERLAKAIETGQLAGIKVAEANGQLSKFSAAVAEARVHAAAYAAQLADLDDQLARARSIPDLPGQKAEITRLEGQRQELVLSGQQQRTTDQAAMDSHTIAGASSQALAQMVQSWDDMATQIAETLKQTVGGFNDDIVKSLITPRLNHREIETMFGETARSGAGSLLKTGLQKGEAGLLGAFGVGGKLDGSSEASALWVRIAGAIDTGNKAAESIPGMSAIGRTVDKIFGGSGSGGSSVATLVTSGLNRIASPSMTAAAKLADSIFGPLPSGTGGAGASSEGPGVLPWAATSNSPATQQYLKAASSFADLLPGVNQPAGQDVDNLNTSGSTTVTRPSNATANAVSGMVTKLGGAVLSGIFQGAFAGGGDVLANRPALVGELGPELFVPRSAGTIVPNRQLGGSTTHNISIDARGANDPAQTEAAIHRAMRSYLPQAVSASVAAVRDRQLRRPSTSG